MTDEQLEARIAKLRALRQDSRAVRRDPQLAGRLEDEIADLEREQGRRKE